MGPTVGGESRTANESDIYGGGGRYEIFLSL